ncbi:type III-B CRISPR module RAMP protein Cmr6 [Paenibacillus melissococcoides]|uniref:Type III-B CRISPR module RAMP protein Cmr6 n=1 Tax=Paenibacillus melissococcoides TaxID=2912268 RepID=A0ABN8U9U5_9BACL|nr:MULTISPECIES: type III-B CRISPR module RAMP protein Cmr6 [Paenibacillus]MEB9892282.1 type III-B CRISPR module RAMP protein Cmr6 [Bacillus cereus]CAH8247886.1 type III-B CRISPR module RAMP protein Cmr6 [Paenibacillus melissococcoides]CAH8719249.1 type III-B CRISPR module RAMP protein Cmr6 [Paenibacillus melissococcoides]CAH8720260.1 type III-B CRISPR module RAMP protein Cmr6 [Paenibacillus melissococcoides]
MTRDQSNNRNHKSHKDEKRKDENHNDGKGFLPKDTEEFIKNAKIDNLFLSLYRLPRKKIIKGKVSIEPHGYIALQKEFQSRGKTTIETILKSLRNRMERFAQQFPSGIPPLQYEPADKLLLGIGALSPYSNILLMTLHPVYGIPYIPSSSLKGAVRHCWIQERHEGSESEALKDALFVKCFGTGAENEDAVAGKLIFFDAFPAPSYTIVLDVQTPHFKGYYETKGEEQPTDAISPVPIFIPAVTKTKFTIFIGSAEGLLAEQEISEVRKMVEKTLSEYGLGAKTALGYGLGK